MNTLRRCAVRLWRYLEDEYLDDESAVYVYRGEVLGHGCTSQRWYSMCSRHHSDNRDTSCPLCMAGKYVTWWKNKVTSKLYEVSPRAWRWWANLERRTDLEEK